MAQHDFKASLEEALTKAFACRDKKARSAYLRLADFYENQAQKEALRETGVSCRFLDDNNLDLSAISESSVLRQTDIRSRELRLINVNFLH